MKGKPTSLDKLGQVQIMGQGDNGIMDNGIMDNGIMG